MLHEKIAVVTGASKGIGRAIAIELAKAGAHVVVNYHGSAGKAEETCQEIRQNNGTCESMQFDVADFNQTEEAMKTILEKHGRIDILVNNAGITRDGLILRMSEEQFSEVIDTNLKGTFYMSKLASKQMMKQRQGRIINISSVSGVMGNAGQANYAASKAGVIGLTKSMARELASRNITVNAVAPGFIDTDMTKELPQTVIDRAVAQIPLGHFGKPEDIAGLVCYLASEQAAYVTGQVICVDGGMAM